MRLSASLVLVLLSGITCVAQDTKSKETTPAPLYIIDGREIKSEEVDSLVNRLNADLIAKVEVLKDAKSIEPYGEKGKNGIVKITTHQARKPEEQ